MIEYERTENRNHREVIMVEEKTFKTMGIAGGANLAIGICMLTGGIAMGILLIISGARLLKTRTKIVF